MMRTVVPSSSVTSVTSSGRHFLVAGRRHLVGGGQIRPQLEPVHAAGAVAVGHLLVDDAAAGRHPLHVTGADRALVAEAVGVIDRAGQHVGDGLDAAVRMPGKAAQVVVGHVVAEVVEEQERIDVVGLAEAERAPQMHAGAFEGGGGEDVVLDGTDRHDSSLAGERHVCAEHAL